MSACRTPLFCGNWKLHRTIAESIELATAVRNAVAPLREIEVAVAPVFTALAPVHKRIEGSALALAAQDCFWQDQGAFTGEVSAALLADVGCRYVIVGHSERRHLFGELDGAVQLKVAACLRHGLSPIVCIGETEAERDAGEHFGCCTRQLDAALDGVSANQAQSIVVAYEPVWAIGTGRTATPAQAEEVHAHIRARLVARFGDLGDGVRILYGGSVKPDNVAALMAQPNIDGALVGGASLKADDFLRIVKYRTA